MVLSGAQPLLKKVLLWLLALILLLAVLGTVVGWWLSAPTSQIELQRMQSASHFDGSGFVNPEPQSAWTFRVKDLQLAILGDGQQVTPPGEVPVMDVQADFLDTPPSPGFRYMWLGHSSVLIEIDGVRVLLDPVLSERASPFSFVGPRRFHPPPIALEDLRGIDVALISHNHYDHMDEQTIRQLASNGTRIFVPLGMAPLLAQWQIPEAQIQSFDWRQEVDVNGVRMIATPARHYANRGTFDYKETSWNSWSIVGPEHRVFYSGDTGASKLFAEVGADYGPFNLGVIKVGAYGPGQAWLDVHMEPEDSVQTASDVAADVLLPVHWGTFNLAYHAWDEPAERVLQSATDAGVRLVMPRFGEWVDHTEVPAVDPWWRSVD
jgi:L-ascorbate metabolism protein UlaG (beta-lactamase superfamily)